MNTRLYGNRSVDYVLACILILIAFTMLFPFFYMVVVSFASFNDYTNSELLLWPKEWVLDAYKYIFASEAFVHSIYVTIGITVVGTLVDLAMTSTMAYGLTREAPGKGFINFMVLFTFLFSGGMIPNYLVIKATGLLDSYWALIVPGAISAFNLIVLRQFFRSIPSELSEAAIIDGASELKVYTRIILPLSKPALATFGLFYAVGHWNSFFDAILYLNDSSKWTVQVILRQLVIQGNVQSTLQSTIMLQQLRSQQMPPPVTIGMAAVLVSTAPILVVYPFLQKHFAKGVMLGSVKG